MKQRDSENDIRGDEIIRFRKIESSFLKRCRHFGYEEVKTSTIKPLYFFVGALNEKSLMRTYSFIDWDGWSGERVALKPDSTPCLARFYRDHLYSANPRQKLCYVENHFLWSDSHDELSERWQFGVENIGSSEAEADIESIYMAYDILRESVSEDIHLYLSYPALIREIVGGLSLSESGKDDFISEMIKTRHADQIRKILGKIDQKDLFETGERELFESLFLMRGKSSDYLKNLRNMLNRPKYGSVGEYIGNFISVCEILDRLECPYIIDFSLLGDFRYYTGIQFQFLSVADRGRSTNKDVLCAGGRYDNLIGDISKAANSRQEDLPEKIPAVGFALYVRNIIKKMMSHDNVLTDRRQNICICISNVTKKNVRTGQNLSDKLSRLGFLARITFDPVEQEKYESFGLVIEVDHERFGDGYQILFSQKIGKPLLMNLFGEFNGR